MNFSLTKPCQRSEWILSETMMSGTCTCLLISQMPISNNEIKFELWRWIQVWLLKNHNVNLSTKPTNRPWLSESCHMFVPVIPSELKPQLVSVVTKCWWRFNSIKKRNQSENCFAWLRSKNVDCWMKTYKVSWKCLWDTNTNSDKVYPLVLFTSTSKVHRHSWKEFKVLFEFNLETIWKYLYRLICWLLSVSVNSTHKVRIFLASKKEERSNETTKNERTSEESSDWLNIWYDISNARSSSWRTSQWPYLLVEIYKQRRLRRWLWRVGNFHHRQSLVPHQLRVRTVGPASSSGASNAWKYWNFLFATKSRHWIYATSYFRLVKLNSFPTR